MGLDKKQKVEAAVAALQKRFGATVVRTLTPNEQTHAIPVVATGFRAVDKALGIGGIPRGHLTQFLGNQTSGKHSLAFKVMAHAQKAGDMVAYLDVGKTFDPDYAARAGVDVTKLVVIHVRTAESIVDVAQQLITSRSLGCLIVDLSGEQAGALAASFNVAPLIPALHHALCVFIVLTPYTANHSTPLAFQSTVRLRLTHLKWLRLAQDVSGYRVQVSILKNKFAPLHKDVSFVIGFSTSVQGDGS